MLLRMLHRPPNEPGKGDALERRRVNQRERQKRFNKRLRAGITVVSIEVDGVFLNTLLRLRWLREQDTHDSKAIAKAIEAMHKSIT